MRAVWIEICLFILVQPMWIQPYIRCEYWDLGDRELGFLMPPLLGICMAWGTTQPHSVVWTPSHELEPFSRCNKLDYGV